MTEQVKIQIEEQDETPTLRCNRCGKPITAETAILTPTGYRCKECVAAQQKTFDTTKPFDPVIGFVISALISFAGSWLVPRIGFFTIFIATGLGTLIYQAVRLAVNKRRSKALNWAILAGALVGALPTMIPEIIAVFTLSGDAISATMNFLPLIWRIVYAAIVASSAYAQTKGIRL